MKTITIICTALATSCMANAAAADPQFGFRVGAGYQQDSNVNVAELDATTGEADSAFLLEAGGDVRLPVGDRLTLLAGYNYSSTSYRTWSEYDVAIHHGRAAAEYRLHGFDAGISLDRFDASLSGEEFMEVTRLSPSLARLLGDSVYLRASYAVAWKTYPGESGRGADNRGWRADAYWLLDGMARYLALTLQADSEDARADEFDYDGRLAKLAFGRRFDMGRRELEVKARLQLEGRDYRWSDEDSGEARRDERFRAGLGAALPLAEHVEITGELEYADTASTLAAADFAETVYAVGIGMRF